MADRASDTSPLVRARVAGVLALIVLVAGSFASFVDGRLVVPGDAAATAGNIVASEALFRVGFVSGLVMYTVFIFYAWVLYDLLRPVDRNHAVVMLVLALAGVPIAMLNQIHRSAALLLLGGADVSTLFTADQANAQVMLLLGMHRHGNLVAVIFWGLWLFPLGSLVYRSGFLPRILGVLLMIGCFGWLMVFVQRFLLPGFEALAHSRYAAHLAELSFMLWLLIKGVDVQGWQRRVLESA